MRRFRRHSDGEETPVVSATQPAVSKDALHLRMQEALEAFRQRDYEGALFRLKRLEADGYLGAATYVANMYEKGYRGVPQDVGKALEIYHRLAEENDPHAMARLAQLYYAGTHVKRDYERAFHWYERLARAGDARAQFTIGNMHMRGFGVRPDKEAAHAWFREAARNGNVNGARNDALLRLGRGDWRAVFQLAKALCLTAYVRLFDRYSDRAARL
jgi:TPR repeat protein